MHLHGAKVQAYTVFLLLWLQPQGFTVLIVCNELPKLIVFIGKHSLIDAYVVFIKTLGQTSWCTLLFALLALYFLWFCTSKHSESLETTVEYSCGSLSEVSDINECRERSAGISLNHAANQLSFPCHLDSHCTSVSLQHGCYFNSRGVLLLVTSPIHSTLMPVLSCIVFTTAQWLNAHFLR